MITTIFISLLGFVMLYYGGELLVRSSVNLALKLNISTLVVGLTVVSFATSSPELFISLQSVLDDRSSIALGNTIGSNIANITLVLGISAIIYNVRVSQMNLKLNVPVMVLSTLFLGLFLYFFNSITFLVGIFFVFSLVVSLILIVKTSKKKYKQNNNQIILENNIHSLYKSFFILFLSVLLLKFGADFLVEGAVDIASYFNVSDKVIAVTILAVGTSFPELATSIVAAFKKEDSLVVGNLIGSNIFNILAVLGITSIISEVKMIDKTILSFDYIFMLLSTFILVSFLYFFTKQIITRMQGVILLLIYLLYLFFTISLNI